MNKVSKIKKVSFNSEWKTPSGTYVYYHEIEFENGDSGSCGRNKQMPDDMKVGTEVEYQINDKKIKFIKSMSNNINKFQKKSYNGGKKGPEEYLGYSYAYAKDMVVAGKTSEEDLKNLKFIAESIYEHIKILLSEEPNKDKDNYPF